MTEFRVAQDEAIALIPQHERLGDRLHRVAQAHVGGGVGLLQGALLADVDRDADEMASAVEPVGDDLGAGPQPDIGAVGSRTRKA